MVLIKKEAIKDIPNYLYRKVLVLTLLNRKILFS